MFLHAVDERSVGLAVVGRVAVKAGNLVDSVRSGGVVVFFLVRRSRKDVEEEFVTLMSCCLSIFFRGLERVGW